MPDYIVYIGAAAVFAGIFYLLYLYLRPRDTRTGKPDGSPTLSGWLMMGTISFVIVYTALLWFFPDVIFK